MLYSSASIVFIGKVACLIRQLTGAVLHGVIIGVPATLHVHLCRYAHIAISVHDRGVLQCPHKDLLLSDWLDQLGTDRRVRARLR